MTDDLVEQIVARLAERLAPPPPEPPPPPPPTKPHRVHVKNAIAMTRSKVQTFDPERAPARAKPAGDVDDVPYWLIDDVTTTYQGPLSCPDCGRGLRSDGEAMACIRLELGALAPCHAGCTVACGVKSDG